MKADEVKLIAVIGAGRRREAGIIAAADVVALDTMIPLQHPPPRRGPRPDSRDLYRPGQPADQPSLLRGRGRFD